MQTTTLDFPRNARRVYTAVKHVFQARTRFSNVACDDVHFHDGGAAWLVRFALYGEHQGKGGSKWTIMLPF